MNEIAKVAYDGYRNHTGGVSLVSGAAIPEWDDLPEVIRQAWVAAAEAVREQFCTAMVEATDQPING